MSRMRFGQDATRVCVHHILKIDLDVKLEERPMEVMGMISKGEGC